MEVDDNFGAVTAAFLSWLSEMGVRVNPKMALVDLRSEGRGRGVGEFSSFHYYTFPRCQISILPGSPGIPFQLVTVYPNQDIISCNMY